MERPRHVDQTHSLAKHELPVRVGTRTQPTGTGSTCLSAKKAAGSTLQASSLKPVSLPTARSLEAGSAPRSCSRLSAHVLTLTLHTALRDGLQAQQDSSASPGFKSWLGDSLQMHHSGQDANLPHLPARLREQ